VAQNGGVTSTATKQNGMGLSLVRVLTINQGFGDLVEYLSPDLDAERLVYSNTISISSLDFALQDMNGNNLDLQNSELIIELTGYIEN
jgi:hypothetical protein